MAWTITLEVVDCSETSTKLAGASVLDGSTSSTSVTDATGHVTFTKDDALATFIVKVSIHGYIGGNKSLNRPQAGTTQSLCLNPLPVGTDPDNPDAPTGHGGDTGGGCFIVTATTGSAQSAEITRLRHLRDRVASTSRLGDQLIAVIYRDYAQFSPAIAVELERDLLTQKAVLWGAVRPLLAWYSLAGVLAFEHTDRAAVAQASRDVRDACPRYLGGPSIIAVLEAIRAGHPLPVASHPLLQEFAPRIQAAAGLRFASWAILDPLLRAWRCATERLDVVDQVAQWLATAPLDALSPPRDPQLLAKELTVLATFFDFQPAARRQIGERLIPAWPDAADALARAGFGPSVCNQVAGAAGQK